MDCSLPGSSVHGILQARILEWVAISFSKSVSSGKVTDKMPRGHGVFHLLGAELRFSSFPLSFSKNSQEKKTVKINESNEKKKSENHFSKPRFFSPKIIV